MSRKLIERIVAKEILNETGFESIIGHTKYFELKITNCESDNKYIVIGKSIPKEAAFDPANCLCGNDICGEGEIELNCPADCTEKFSAKGIKRLWIMFIASLILILIGDYTYGRIRGHRIKAIEYIDNNFVLSLKNGVEREKIIHYLAKAGWPEKVSSKALDAVYRDFFREYSKLKEYIKAELGRDIDPELIKNALVKKGWCKTIVGMAFENIEVEPLLKEVIDYINKELDKGIPEDIIKQALIKAGWKKEIAEEALRNSRITPLLRIK